MLDPSTALGGVILSILGAIGASVVIAALSWILGPLKWLFQARLIRKIILNNHQFRFVFNPDSNRTKIISFLQDGQIGEGRNENENKWQIRRGKLEILAVDGKWYNRFRHDPETVRMVSTNEPGMRSINGQYFIPIQTNAKLHMSNNPSNSVPDILRQLSEGLSTQTKLATKYWLALAIVSTFTVVATPQNGHLPLPFFSIPVSIEYFYPLVFILLSLLVIVYGSANSQAIRTRKLIQRYIDNSGEKFLSDGDLHIQDVFDSLVSPSINRVGPLAQILQGKNQFFSKTPSRSTCLSILLGVYFVVLRVVALLAIEIFPTYALIVSIDKGKLFSSDAPPLNIPVYFFWFVGGMAFLILIQLFLLDISYSIGSFKRICNCQRTKKT